MMEDELMVEGDVTEYIHTPNRVMSPCQWPGGKGKLVKKILPHFRYDRKVYIEPFCGMASMFWHKKLHEVEVLNDLNGDVVNLFRVLQDKNLFEDFSHKIYYTLYSREEFAKAIHLQSDDPVERAWGFYVRQNQGFSGISTSEGTWSRAFISKRGMAATTCTWLGRMKLLPKWHERLMRVQIDHQDAVKSLKYWGGKDTFAYLDPPYVLETRLNSTKIYKECEMDDEQHKVLIQALLDDQETMFVLSGYDHPIYKPLEDAGWQVEKFEIFSSIQNRKPQGDQMGEKSKRTEVLWISPNAKTNFNIF